MILGEIEISRYLNVFNLPFLLNFRVFPTRMHLLRGFQHSILFFQLFGRKHVCTLAPAGIFRGERTKPSKGGLVRGPPDAGEVFRKLVKINEKFTFLNNFNGNFAIFSKLHNILSNFSRKLGKIFRNMHLQGVWGRSPPRSQRIYQKESKTQWKPIIFC